MVRTRTLTIERNEKKMDMPLDCSKEALQEQDRLVSELYEKLKQSMNYSDGQQTLNAMLLNHFRVKAYVLHQLIQLNLYGLDALSCSVETTDQTTNDTLLAIMGRIADSYKNVKQFLRDHQEGDTTFSVWLDQLYLKVEPLAYALWLFDGTLDDLVNLAQMQCSTDSGQKAPPLYPGIWEACSSVVSLSVKDVDQQLDARCKLAKDLNDTLQLDNTEAAKFFAITEPALVEQFVKEGK